MNREAATLRLALLSGVAVFGSFALISLTWAPWFTNRPPLAPPDDPTIEIDAWAAFSSIDVLFTVAAAAASVLAFVGFAARASRIFWVAAALTLAAAGLAAYRLLNVPEGPPGLTEKWASRVDFGSIDPAWGIWVSLLVATLAAAASVAAATHVTRRG